MCPGTSHFPSIDLNSLQLLFEHSIDSVACFDAEQRLLYLNPRALARFHISLDEVLGKRIEQFLPDTPSRRLFQAALAKVMATRQPEKLLLLNDARACNDALNISPLIDLQGCVAGAFVIGREENHHPQLMEELERRSNYLRALIDNFPFPIWLKDRQSRLLVANQALADLAGTRTPQELELKSDYDFFPADLAASYIEDDREVMSSGKPKNIIEEFIDEKQQHHWIDTYKSPVLINGHPAGTVGFFRDISEQRKLELEGAERKRYLELLIKNSPDVIVRYDLKCKRVFVSGNYEQVYDQPISAVLGKTPHEAWGQQTMSALEFTQRLQTIMDSGVPGDIELGTLGNPSLWMLIRCAPEFDEHGRVVSVLTMGRDVGALKQAERQLKDVSRQFRTLAEHSPDYIIRYDRDFRRVYVNPQFCMDMEKSEAELLHTQPLEDHLKIDTDVSLYHQALAECMRTGQPGNIEISWHNYSGRRFCTHFRLTPEFDAHHEVVSVLAIGRDITDIDQYRQQIHQLAYFDALTALPNRAMFMQQISILMSAGEGQQFGLMLLDLDRFKEINDTMGHGAGDQLLKEVGHRISHCVRTDDTVSRLGGDEFAILLPKLFREEELSTVGQKIIDVFTWPFMIQGKELFVSASIGIAFFPSDSREIEGLFRYADSAMYHAKQQGRNNFQFYTGELTARIAERMEIEADLRQALKRDELELYYQPQVRLSDGAIVGAEALLRWHHPSRGMVPPDKFISTAEECGLIIEIGEWVLREACATTVEWNRHRLGEEPFIMAVNLSARQFIHNDLFSTIYRILIETGCEPGWLELEITESLLLESNDSIRTTLRKLCEMGLSFSIDDFGTGYSSLAYLNRFPINQIKIDRSFVRNLTMDEDADSLVQAIISLSTSMHKSALAEGVETAEQAIFLKASGCMMAQGYLYGKPMPKHVFETSSGVDIKQSLGLTRESSNTMKN